MILAEEKGQGPTQKKPLPEVENRPIIHEPSGETGVPDVLDSIAADILQEIRGILIEQESTYPCSGEKGTFSSIWAHSVRVAHIAHHIATQESWQPEPALLAGLLHDTGKVVHGHYHGNDNQRRNMPSASPERF